MSGEKHTLNVIGAVPSEYPIADVAAAAYDELGQTDALAIEVVFASEDEIRRLNAENRGIDRVTDVLSFPYVDGVRESVIKLDDYPDDVDGVSGELTIGSVVICEKRASEQAEDYGHSLKREVAYLALHGVLHCFGYDHMTPEDEEQMTALADKIMKKINLTRDKV